MLEETVVTALGISKEKKTLGYAVQDVKGDALNQASQLNVANALQGKVSGVQITQAGGAVGASQRILIRGNSSFNSNDPLIVVDGVPMDGGATSGKADGTFQKTLYHTDCPNGWFGQTAENQHELNVDFIGYYNDKFGDWSILKIHVFLSTVLRLAYGRHGMAQEKSQPSMSVVSAVSVVMRQCANSARSVLDSRIVQVHLQVSHLGCAHVRFTSLWHTLPARAGKWA